VQSWILAGREPGSGDFADHRFNVKSTSPMKDPVSAISNGIANHRAS
jgi:hypothetical protein